MLRALPLIAILAALATPASAHTRSEFQATWDINEANVDLILTAADIEIARIGAGRRVKIKSKHTSRTASIL